MPVGVYSQRPRTITADDSEKAARSAPTPAPAPQTFKAKYEGGVIGYA